MKSIIPTNQNKMTNWEFFVGKKPQTHELALVRNSGQSQRLGTQEEKGTLGAFFVAVFRTQKNRGKNCLVKIVN